MIWRSVIRRRSNCPVCGKSVPVTSSGVFAVHMVRGKGAGSSRVPCPGSGQDAGLW